MRRERSPRGRARALGAGLALALAALSPPPGLAEPAAEAARDRTRPETAWRVATRAVPPLVLDDGVRLTGFSVDLWNAIAGEVGVATRFERYDTLPEMFEAVETRRADLAVAAISITAEREQRFDFSVTMLEAGLQIAVRPAAESTGASTLHALRAVVADPAFAQALAALAGLVLAVSGLVWALERRHPEGMAAGSAAARGYAQAVWWTLSSLAAQAEEMPRSALGRAVAVVWLFACIGFVTWFSAGLASTATVERLRGEIGGPGDLPGKRVGTLGHSTSAAYLADRLATPVPFANLEEACAALEAGRIAAILYDAPALRHFAAGAGRGRLALVGASFHRQAYGILFAAGDPRRKRVNRALLALREDGRYDAIHARWFGPEAGEPPAR